MKFSDIEAVQWKELQPYLDTCILPVTGMDGSEEPWQATDALEALRDVLDLIEVPFRGRVVTYPAFHYFGTGQAAAAGLALLEELCERLRLSGFRYIVLVSAASKELAVGLESASGSDLLIHMTREELCDPEVDAKRAVAAMLTALWNGRQSV
ncbi:DUF2487 family protein [Paenibacillus sp. YYML68]|uniref:DUF2487 family protein n=1 Tax=Paenibacillus sp. YYML68 TaxID=2909250 RepID=UPI00249333A2|nr:DUF2487 family protein [Paenibacillus sp. YYML68]